MTEALPTLAAVERARLAILGVALRTPLVRLNVPETAAEIHLKLENLQPIGSFKIRGALNAIAQLPAEALARGVAWGARPRGIPCTVLAPDTAPPNKRRAVERLGARLVTVPFDAWWHIDADRLSAILAGAEP